MEDFQSRHLWKHDRLLPSGESGHVNTWILYSSKMLLRLITWCLCTLVLCVDLCLCIKCNRENCVLPRCSCASRHPPPGMPRDDMPQIVTLSFDDQITDQNMEYYRLLFTKERLNQNGCPIQVHKTETQVYKYPANSTVSGPHFD